MQRLRLLVVIGSVWFLPAVGVASDRVDAGNDQYRFVLNADLGGFRQRFVGYYTVLTGPAHPVTPYLARPGSVLDLHPDCITCAGVGDKSFTVVRSYSGHTDYSLGRNVGFFRIAEPGFDCLYANEMTTPVIEEIVEGGELRGARITWHLLNGPDDLDIELLGKVHGEDFVGSSAEVSIRIVNHAPDVARVGIRNVWHVQLRGGGGNGGALAWHVGLRPPFPPNEQYTTVETEWDEPQFVMWEANAFEIPSAHPTHYSSAAAVSGPWTLDPPPTPPDFIQHGALEPFVGSESLPGGGAADSCFTWRIPDPPRPIVFTAYNAMVSYWGPDEARALEIPPGGEVTVTQYLVAFREYPLSVDAGGPYEADCPAGRVALAGSSETIEPTVATVEYRWSSSDPRVSFVDATDPNTEAILPGGGTFPVELTAAVGAYQASEATTITTGDVVPPVLMSLTVSPSALWPPNHHMVEVRVSAAVSDDCDAAPGLRLVSVTSSEPARARRLGAGDTEVDIEDADIGTDDRSVLLRAERAGTRGGRIYTLTYEAVDASGNVSPPQAVTVTVGHDRGVPRR